MGEKEINFQPPIAIRGLSLKRIFNQAQYFRIVNYDQVSIWKFEYPEIVVLILKQVFFYTEEKAEQLMLQVHHSDKAMVGVYTYDIAMSKVTKATRMAREQNYPLRLTLQPE